MKKLLLLTMFLIGILLTGCGAQSEMENPDVEPYLFDSYLSYNLDTLTYTTGDQSDILYGLGDLTTDYLMMKNSIETLSSNEEEAYSSILSIVNELKNSNVTFNLKDLTTYTSKELEWFATNADIVLTITDIITFNTLKSELEEYQNSYIPYISRQEYIENLIERDITSEELRGLNTLQEKYYVLINDYVPSDYSFKINTFDELLTLFDTSMEFVPVEAELSELEAAYNIINGILTE